MFEASLVNDKARTARPYTVSLSLLLQIAVAAAAVAYPLWHIEALPVAKLQVPSPFRRAVRLVQVEPVRASPQTLALKQPPKLTFPTPRRTPAPATEVIFKDDLSSAIGDASPDNGPLIPWNGPSEGKLDAVAPPPRTQPRQQPATPTNPPAAQTGPVRPGGRVRPPQLLHEVKPAYPLLARASRTQGTVRIEAVIARDGVIRDARVVSGHPLLVAAALDAVRQWRYRPTILNEEPVEVALALEVHFSLSQ